MSLLTAEAQLDTIAAIPKGLFKNFANISNNYNLQKVRCISTRLGALHADG